MTEHTKEPWRIEPATKKDNWRIVGANGQVVSTFSGNMDMDNARRIVACVNKFAGMSTAEIEELPADVPTFLARLSERSLQCDHLREVCAEAYQFAGAYDAPVEVLDNLSAAANGWPLPHESFLPVMDSEAVAQRDQLLAALEAIIDLHDSARRGSDVAVAIGRARQAIAAVKGK